MTQTQEVNKCYWKNGAADLLDTGLPQTFHLLKERKKERKSSICEV